MNKLFTKIAALALGAAMAVGVGVAVSSKNVSAAFADTYSASSVSTKFSDTSSYSWGSLTWTLTHTGGTYQSIDGTKGQQIGSGNSPCTAFSMKTNSSISNVTSVAVNASIASSGTAKLNIKVGSTSFLSNQSLTTSATNYTGSGSATTGQVEISFTNKSKAFYIKSFTITYSAGTNYTVSFNNNTGSGTMSNATTSGPSYTTPACTFTKTDYVFSKWALNSTSGTQYAVGETITGITGNITLYAIWVEDHSDSWVQDTFDADDLGAGGSYAAFSVNGSSGATYVGYCMKNNSNIQFNTFSSSKNRSIATSASGGYIRRVSVTWGDDSGKHFTVYCSNTAYSNSSTGASGTAQSSTISSTNTTVDITGDYSYVSLYPNGAIYPASVTFYWEAPTTYTVSFAVNTAGYGTVSPSSISNVPEGASITSSSNTLTINGTTVTATPTTQTAQYTYAFSSWSKSSGTVDDDITITANFTRTTRTYTVTYDKNTTDSVSGMPSNDTNIAYGTSHDLSNAEPSRTNYDFGGWATTSGSTSAVTSVTVNSNVTVYAIWVAQKATYTVTNSMTNITLSSTADILEDEALSLTLTAPDHYTLPSSITVTMGGNSFSNFTYTRNSGNKTASFTVAENIIKGNLVFSGSAVPDAQYTVTYTAGSNGTGSFADANQWGGTYTLKTFAELTGVSASSGYEFKNYTVGGVEKDPGDTISLSADTPVTVNFKIKPSEVTVLTSVATYASNNAWVNSTKYTSMILDSNVTAEVSGGANSGKYYSNDESWRIYSSETGKLTITVTGTGNSLSSITLTFPSTDSPAITYGGNAVTSDTAVSVTGTSAEFDVASGKAHITDISVTYIAASAPVATYTIIYDANDASAEGSMTPTVGAAPEVASCQFTLSGHSFARWNSQADGEGDDYAVGSTVSESITLYAIWQESVAPIEGNVTMTGVTNYQAATVNGHPGIKCGAGSSAGAMSLTLTQANITKIKVYIAGWGTDTNRTINVSIDNGTISESSITITGDSAISGSSTSFTLDGDETDYKFEFTISNAPANSVITLTAAIASKNRFVVWGATDLFAETFASEFLTNLTCNASGTSAPTFAQGYSWSSFEGIYNGLDAEEQGRLQDADALESGTQIEQAMARYDYIEGKYNPDNSSSSPWKNFIGRTVHPLGSQKVLIDTIVKDANSTAIIVVTSMIGLSAVGGYFFLRKRKENI